jgi:hypothetical protein
MTQNQFETIVKESVSKSEVCRKLGYSINGTGLRKLKLLIEQYDVDVSHFSHQAAVSKFNRKYELIEKMCPVCGTLFETQLGHSREKQTCSHSCSNTYFRSGENNPNYKAEKSDWGYRKICFSKWKKECIICGFDKVVDVHHLDHNNKNNDINNLVPLCPNHHMMLHTKKYNTEVVTEIKKITGISS